MARGDAAHRCPPRLERARLVGRGSGALMAAYRTELHVDMGPVGCKEPRHPFSVRLVAGDLARLIRDVKNAHRFYELMLIDRPGDVLDYVSVKQRRRADRTGHAVGHALHLSACVRRTTAPRPRARYWRGGSFGCPIACRRGVTSCPAKTNRRRGMELIEDRRRTPLGPLLQFP